jgi:DNA-binding NarL/FixJ family response regulator
MVGGSYFPQFPQRDRVGLPATATLSPKAEASAPIALPPTFVLDGEPPRRTAGREQTSPASCFTPREQQVVAALQRGLSNKIIAADLGMSENTVKVHVRHVMRKLRASNRTQAALMCRAQLEGDGLEAASA